MAKRPQNEPIDVELTEDMATGAYSNLVMISHSPTEFVMDFITMLPGMPKAKVVSRIILAPEHAKSFLAALKENIDIYEQSFSKIKSNDNLTFPYGGKIGEA
ncbi:MAG: DUF3467 domain-containing protein [Thermonemataceae bacterium]|nr:DUF3467 domain-containing protein [Thermonemataceae bacterium]